MSAADSSSVFFARVEELGLLDLKDRFTAHGWTSFSDFAFACSDFKGSDPALFKNEVIVPLVGEEVNRVTRIRRLYMQSYAVGAAEMEKFANPVLDKPLAMHPVDRAEAFGRVSRRMVGFTISHESEPSNALIDKCSTFLQNGYVKHIPWEKRTSRDQEVVEEYEVPGLKLNENGIFVQVPSAGPDANLSSELPWDLAMRRCDVAMDIAGLCTYEAASLWTEALKAAYLAPPPPGYRRVSWAQLRNADKKLWQLTSSDCKAGCKAKPGELQTQFEVAFKNAIFSPEVRHLLNPLPDGGGGASSAFASAGPDQSATIRRLEGRLKTAEEQIRGQKRRPQDQGGRPSGGRDSKGGGKGGRENNKGGGNGIMKQYQALGLITRTKDNEPICFSFNMQAGCSKAQPGQRCHGGLHVCGSPQCQDSRQPHSSRTH
jgi:hypothetical protein